MGSLKLRYTSTLPWLGVLILLILAIAFLLPVLPNDYWWYLRLGKDIVINKAVPLVDTYSSTASGQPTTYPMWLAAVLLYGIHQIGGITLTVFLRGLLIATYYFFLWLIGIRRGAPTWLVTLLTLVFALAGANNWAVRPQMFVYPLFGLSLYILTSPFFKQSHQENEESEIIQKPDEIDPKTFRRFYWLIPIALLWANLHGSVIVLFFLSGPYFLFYQRNRKFLFILIMSFLITFINPRGPMLWVDTFQVIQATGNQFSQEWKPPINSGWQMNLFFVWLLAIIPLLAFSPRKLKLFEWVWFLGFGWMALSGVRYVIWFLAILMIFSSWLISGWLQSKSKGDRFQYPVVNIIFLIIMILLPITLLPGIRANWWQAAPEDLSSSTPVEAVNWLKKHPDLPGEIFNDYIFGSYLIYSLPERPVWIDTRFYPYPETLWEDYLSIANGEYGWQEKLKDPTIGTLVLDQTGQKNLILQLQESEEYCEVYQDPVAIIFTVCNE